MCRFLVTLNNNICSLRGSHWILSESGKRRYALPERNPSAWYSETFPADFLPTDPAELQASFRKASCARSLDTPAVNVERNYRRAAGTEKGCLLPSNCSDWRRPYFIVSPGMASKMWLRDRSMHQSPGLRCWIEYIITWGSKYSYGENCLRFRLPGSTSL